MRKRLKPEDAKFLGFNIKPKEALRNPRYNITSEQWDSLQIFRNNKVEKQTEDTPEPFRLPAWSEDGRLLDIDEYCEKYSLPIENVRSYKLVSHTGIPYYNIQFKENYLSEIEAESKVYENLINFISNNPATYPTLKRKINKDSHLLVINPADVHIGKLASSFESHDEYNTSIAVQRVREGVDGLLNKSANYNLDKILFVGGNDILHIDNPKRTTTSGTPQDTCGMWYDNFTNAFRLYVEVLEKLISVANVHFMFCPSNHDFMSGFHLCFGISQYFKNCKNISFDVDMSHRKYYMYGENLIGGSHGDGAKANDLPLLMAEEAKHFWAAANHKYFYTHHVHHKNSKDYMSVCVESMRSISGADSYHHKHGYQHAPKAMEGFIHHKKYGQIGRFNHIF